MRKFTKYPSNYVKAYTKIKDCYFVICFNGGGTGRRYGYLGDAIKDLKAMIDNAIRNYGVEYVDFEDCFIAEEINGDEIGEVAYRAADDSYFSDYL